MEQNDTKIERKHPLALCEECPLYNDGVYVPPDTNGNTKAKYVFVGEAPGVKEAKVGKPFKGVSGQLLDAVLTDESVGINRSDAVLTNACLCRPRSNKTPTAAAMKCCKPALDATIEEADPEYVLAMGGTAASSILGRKVKITQERVGPPKLLPGKDYKFVPTVHPAACLRNPNLFNSLVADIKKLTPRYATVLWEPPKYKDFNEPHMAIRAITQIADRRGERLVLDLEVGEDKDEDYGHPNTMLCAGLGYEPGKVVVIGRDAIRSQAVREALSKLFAAKKLTEQNGKYDNGVLYRMGFGRLKTKFDTMLASYTMNEMKGVHGLEYQGQEHLGAPSWKKEINEHKKDGWMHIPPDVLHKYNAYDVGITWDIQDHWEREMGADQWKLHDWLCWVSDEYFVIESEGVLLDLPYMQMLDHDMGKELVGIKDELQDFIADLPDDLWGYTDPHVLDLMVKSGNVNPNSPVQVKAVLEALTGSTLNTTDAEMLEFLRDKPTGPMKTELQKFCESMLQWRSVGKIHGTYVKGWMRAMDDDDRVHPTLKLHGTETGRTSCVNPNVQNPPRGPVFRRAVIAGPGKKLIYADFANIEGRVVCTLCQDEAMAEVLRDPNRDIHGEIAAMIFGPNFDKEDRVLAKTVVHGTNYKRTPHGIAQGLGVPLRLAEKVDHAYHSKYTKVKVWQREIKKQVLESDEELVGPWGHHRRFGLITRDNAEDVYGEALAFLPQNIASCITLTASVRINKAGIPVRIFIHDGIVAEVEEAVEQEAVETMKRIMDETAREYTEYVPFPVDIASGDNWAALE